MLDRPIHFAPYLKSVIWGGGRIASYKGIETDLKSVGESWEISAVPGHVSVVDRGALKGMSLTELIASHGADLLGPEVFAKYGGDFPLLIKFIDAHDRLSLQVHPGDELAAARHNCPGKTELWRVIETTPDAKIYVGLKQEITPEEYERRVADHTIMDVICTYDSAPGDTFFLPAGRIHAIGAGNLLAEIQQTSDITYRIYDYDRRDKDGNPRALHTEEARDAIDYTVYPTYRSTPGSPVLADCEYFIVRDIALAGKAVDVVSDRESFTIMMCLAGEAMVDYVLPDGRQYRSLRIGAGDTWLFPAVLRPVRVSGQGELLSIQA